MEASVCDALHGELAQDFTLKQEADRYPSLDEWLAALANDKVLPEHGPMELAGERLLDQGWQMRQAAEDRRRKWPVLCPYCGEPFVKEKSAQKRCVECLERYHRERQERRNARA